MERFRQISSTAAARTGDEQKGWVWTGLMSHDCTLWPDSCLACPGHLYIKGVERACGVFGAKHRQLQLPNLALLPGFLPSI